MVMTRTGAGTAFESQKTLEAQGKPYQILKFLNTKILKQIFSPLTRDDGNGNVRVYQRVLISTNLSPLCIQS